MTQPTQQDIDNAAWRAGIVVRYKAEYDEARVIAESVFGPGWEPCGRHTLVDKQEEQRARAAGDRMQPSATVYSARKSEVKRHFTVVDGIATECPTVEAGFGAMLDETHPTLGFDLRGQWIPYRRYSLFWAGYEAYSPKTAEQLAAAREKRQQREVEKEAQANPLFAEIIRAEGFVPRRKGNPR